MKQTNWQKKKLLITDNWQTGSVYSSPPLVVFPVHGCCSASAHAVTTVQWKPEFQRGLDCFLPTPGATCCAGHLWERAWILGRGNPPAQRAHNSCTYLNRVANLWLTEKRIWENRRQRGGGGRRRTPKEVAYFFPRSHWVTNYFWPCLQLASQTVHLHLEKCGGQTKARLHYFDTK